MSVYRRESTIHKILMRILFSILGIILAFVFIIVLYTYCPSVKDIIRIIVRGK